MSTLLERFLRVTDHLPAPLRSAALTRVMGTAVPYVGTTGIVVESFTHGRIVVRLANDRRVRNHIGGVHAGATTLLAETATGLLVGLELPDDVVPVIKTLEVSFVRRGQGAMRAEATLTEAQRARLRSEPKGEFEVTVVVTDESGREPVKARMLWAWVPKRR